MLPHLPDGLVKVALGGVVVAVAALALVLLPTCTEKKYSLLCGALAPSLRVPK